MVWRTRAFLSCISVSDGWGLKVRVSLPDRHYCHPSAGVAVGSCMAELCCVQWMSGEPRPGGAMWELPALGDDHNVKCHLEI
ncbi:hypothetical protein [Cutibacterium sp.]|uniref:hypothetical protein n=1 Tax=Cutibacterium sp. TaxID=1912221 RepID=UPI0026DD1E37|nr:hypothetical protein [Cutibacterium sp.]